MSVLTVGAMAQEMADEFGEDYTDPDVSDQFVTWTTQVVDFVSTTQPWFYRNGKSTLTLVAAQADYSLTTHIRDIYDTVNKRRVAYTRIERLIAKNTDMSLAGTPTQWFDAGMSGNNRVITLHPTPDATSIITVPTLTLYTISRPPTLASGDSLPFTEEFMNPIREGIRYRVRLNEGKGDLAQLHKQDFEMQVAMINARLHGTPLVPSELPTVQKLSGIRQHPTTPGG